jgi:DNA-binding LacI/PurR family transcriptional regulator
MPKQDKRAQKKPSGKKHRLLQEDLARRLGLSQPTISLALSPRWKKYRISARTRQMVLDEVRRTGYRANAFSTVLQGRTTNLIGLVTGMGDDRFRHELTAHLVGLLEQEGFKVITAFREWKPLQARQHRLATYLQDMVELIVDGVIVLGQVQAANVYAMEKASERRIPAVVINPLPDEHEIIRKKCSIVSMDFPSAGRLAARHLLEKGHRRLVAVHKPGRVVTALANGFVDEVRKAGAEARHVLLQRAFDTTEEGRQAAFGKALALVRKGFTALFCDRDDEALRLVHFLGRNGFAVPEQARVMGFGNDRDAAYWTPPLTSVDMPPDRMAREAVRALLEGLKNPDAAHTTTMIKPVLVARESTGRVKTRE